MKEIILTGYNRKQFKKVINSEEGGGCYLCKRSNEGVYMIRENGDGGAGEVMLDIKWFSVIEDKEEFKFALCNECQKLLSAFIRKIIFDEEFSFLNKDSKEPGK